MYSIWKKKNKKGIDSPLFTTRFVIWSFEPELNFWQESSRFFLATVIYWLLVAKGAFASQVYVISWWRGFRSEINPSYSPLLEGHHLSRVAHTC